MPGMRVIAKALLREGTVITAVLAGIAGVYWGIDRWAAGQPRAQPVRPLATALNLPRVAADGTLGTAVSLDQFAGQSVVVHFGASWCTACMDERPFLEMLWRNRGKSRLTVLDVMVTDDGASIVRSGKVTADGIPTLLDASGDTARLWGVTALPHTVLVGPNGDIVTRLDRPLNADSVAMLQHSSVAEEFIARTTVGVRHLEKAQ